jgi:hypothetical protein
MLMGGLMLDAAAQQRVLMLAGFFFVAGVVVWFLI